VYSYLVFEGVKQATLTGHSWRHGLVVLMFMVAGMVSRRQPGSTEPLYSRPKKRGRTAEPERPQTRRRINKSGTASSEGIGTETVGGTCAGTFSSRSASSDASTVSGEVTDDSHDDGASVAGTNCTMSGGEEAIESAPVPELEAQSAEYKAVFGEKATHDAVLEVVCRAAAIMGKLCGDNREEGFTMREADCKALAEEAFEFVTKYVRALFGSINTTKFHALAYHLLAELLLRGNVIEADTSINEALHKLIKVMWDNSNKQGASFLLQMLRCEQTLAHIIASDEYDKEQTTAGDDLTAGAAGSGSNAGGGRGDEGHGGDHRGIDDDDTSAAADSDESDARVGESDPHVSPGDLLGVFVDLAALDHADAVGGLGVHGDDAEEQMDLDEDGLEGSDSEEPIASAARRTPAEQSGSVNRGEPGASPRGSEAARGGAASAAEYNPAGGGAAAAAPAAATRPRWRPRARISGRRMTVAQAAAADGGRLRQLPDLLGLKGESQLIVVNTFKLDATLPWRAHAVPQLLRAAPDLYRKPWWDHIWYTASDASPPAPRLGLARLLVRAFDGKRRDVVIVQCLEEADARPGCVLTDFHCRRHKWKIDPTTRFPVLAAVPLADVRRLEHVVPDFEDLCERWGLMGTPATIPDSPREREEQRFFTNPFFPWTSNSVADAP